MIKINEIYLNLDFYLENNLISEKGIQFIII